MTIAPAAPRAGGAGRPPFFSDSFSASSRSAARLAYASRSHLRRCVLSTPAAPAIARRGAARASRSAATRRDRARHNSTPRRDAAMSTFSEAPAGNAAKGASIARRRAARATTTRAREGDANARKMDG